MASPHLAEQVGRVLDGRYRVVAPIGTGASAAVYLADDTTLRRRVAIKVLHAALATDQGFLKRFEAEAHTAAALSHPNIMRVLDWGEGSEGPFLVLEYLGGGSLRTLLDKESLLSPSQAVQIGIQTARALDYAHRRGLVHRDIKPANLLFDEEGRLAIADFGLARALAEAAWTEPGGAVLGTARYASPEQVKGQSLDGKSDVYALGLVLYEAVTGEVPFTADTTIATLMARLDAHVTVPGELGELGPIIEAATNPDVAQRITASEMLRALESAATTYQAPERLTLPGAIPIDLDRLDVADPTMLPGNGHAELPTVSVEARPIPPEPKRRLLHRRTKEERAVAAMANGKMSKKRHLPRPKLRTVIISFVILALLSVASVTGYRLYYLTGNQRPVPQLEGLSLSQAEEAARVAKVKLTIDGEKFSEDVPAGITFDQSPDTGTEIYPRQEAHVAVSKGPAPRDVRSFVGQKFDIASSELQRDRFRIKKVDRSDEQVPSGQVLEQTPANGEAARDSEVTLVVSSGPKPRSIPRVAGMSRDAAVAAISGEQLQVAFKEEFNNDVAAGQVAGTSPSAGSQVARGSTVTVIVSKGPDLVVVPNVGGQNVQAANAALTKAGFNVNNVYGPPGGNVFATNPKAGEKIKRGASVALYTQ